MKERSPAASNVAPPPEATPPAGRFWRARDRVRALLAVEVGVVDARAVAAGLNTLLLRAFSRVVPSEQGRLLVLTILIGGLCGVTAVLFHLGILSAERALIDRAFDAGPGRWMFWVVATPTLGALLCGLVLERMPNVRGSGVPQVKVVYSLKSGRLRLRDAVAKVMISTLQIGTGSSLGREGPTVYICSAIASTVGRWFAISPVNLRRLIPVGTAAGIAAAFNAPIAAVTFTIEELVGELDQTMLSGVVVAAALAAIIERTVLGTHPVFAAVHPYELTHASSLLTYALLGVAAALVGRAFTAGILRVRAAFRGLTAIPRFAHPAVGGFVTGVLAVGGVVLVSSRGVTGGGYETLSAALGGDLGVDVLLVMCALKVMATIASYSSGGSGGVFAPSLFIGGMLGGAFGHLDGLLLGHVDVEHGAFALVGMGAVFAAVIRAPITSILIIFEMTNGYGLILPLMIANSTAYLLARRTDPRSIYEALIEQDGIRLPHKSAGMAALSSWRVEQAMTTAGLVVIAADIAVKDALAALRPGLSSFPVVDAAGRFVGIISEARLRHRVAEGAGAELVRAQLTHREVLTGSQPLHDAVVRMNKLGVRQMAVVDADDGARLVGMFAMSDVVRAHASADEGVA